MAPSLVLLGNAGIEQGYLRHFSGSGTFRGTKHVPLEELGTRWREIKTRTLQLL